MKKATYSEISGPGGLLAHCTPFKGNTMHAEWEDGIYEVFSYRTMIACFDPGHGVFVSDDRWSTTTSKQQNLCRAWLATARTEREEQ